jgi:hypothetical protein
LEMSDCCTLPQSFTAILSFSIDNDSTLPFVVLDDRRIPERKIAIWILEMIERSRYSNALRRKW